MNERWNIGLLGGLRAEQPPRTITRFRTQKTGALLGFLAYHLDKAHPREVLIEMLWPEAAPPAGRHNLSVALSSLRHQLEPPGVAAGTVIQADRLFVRLRPAAVRTDVAAFHDALKAAQSARDKAEKTPSLAEAVGLYKGKLLYGYYEDWVLQEQERLAGLFFGALHQLTTHWEQQGERGQALDYARRAVQADPLSEEAHEVLMRLLLAANQPCAALGQYQALRQRLQQELGEPPSPALRTLSRQIEQRHGARAPVAAITPAPCPPGGGPQTPPPQPVAPPQTAGFGAHLPLSFTRFFGRDDEMARLQTMLLPKQTARLVTLTGPAGTGKTRLALETARRLAPAYAGAVWFVPFADLSDPERVTETILGALQVPRVASIEPLAQVAQVLGESPSLLVLDNFEHLVASGATFVQALLARVPRLTCLITSRQLLDVSAERAFVLSPLPVPTGVDRPEPLLANESAQLFVDRAQAARPDFQVTKQNARAVAQLVERLEGIPLAIELAAARAQVLSPAQMAAGLVRRFDLLVGRKRDIAARHQTLRAAVDWSHALLSPGLQRFWARLSVFRGGWTLEAACAVCGEEESERDPVAVTLDYLARLRECSLLVAHEAEGVLRFRMLETLREYAQERLAENGEADALAQQHADYFLRLAKEAEPHLRSPEQAHWFEQLEQEHDNLRAALRWNTTGTANAPEAVCLARALYGFWLVRGHVDEGRSWLSQSLSLAPAPTLERACALNGAGVLAYHQADYCAARAFHEESLHLRRVLGDQRGVARSLGNLGLVAYDQGDYVQARALQQESLWIHRELGDKQGIATALNGLGNVAYYQGDYARARALHQENLAIKRQLGDRWGLAHALSNLALMVYTQGDPATARALYEEGLAIERELGDTRGIANSLNNLGLLAYDQGDHVQARALHVESLHIQRALGDKHALNFTLERIAWVLKARGRLEQAARLMAAAQALREALGTPLPPIGQADYADWITRLREALGANGFARAWAEGYALPLEQAITLALESDST